MPCGPASPTLAGSPAALRHLPVLLAGISCHRDASLWLRLGNARRPFSLPGRPTSSRRHASTRGSDASGRMSLRSGAVGLRGLSQGRPLLSLLDVPAMDRRAVRHPGLVRARRRAVGRDSGSLSIIAHRRPHALCRLWNAALPGLRCTRRRGLDGRQLRHAGSGSPDAPLRQRESRPVGRHRISASRQADARAMVADRRDAARLGRRRVKTSGIRYGRAWKSF
jgi:hypothetical protein